MKTLFLLIFSLFILTVNEVFAASVPNWMPAANNHKLNVAWTTQDTSGNVYTLSGNGIISVTKHDRLGYYKWQVSSKSEIDEIAVQVFADLQSNVVVVGYGYTTPEEGPFAISLVVLKYDSNGSLIYKNNIDGAYTYHSDGANRTNVTAQMDAAGNVYLGTGGTVGNNSKQGFNAIKISPNGTTLWVRTMSFNNRSTFFYVENMALKGEKLTLRGQISMSSIPASSWVLDTLGTNIRIKIVLRAGEYDTPNEPQKQPVVEDPSNPTSFGEVKDYSGNIFPLKWGLLFKKYPKLVENIEYYRFSGILQPLVSR